MQVNRLSLGLQEALKTASNFNTARSETLFDTEKYGVSKEDGEELDFSNLDIEDLNITEDQIAGLFAMFQDEIVAVFGSNLPFLPTPKQNGTTPNDPQNTTSPQNPESNATTTQGQGSRVFTA